MSQISQLRSHYSFLLLALMLAATLAACRKSPETPPTPTTDEATPAPQVSADDVKAKVREALSVTNQFARQRAGEYERKIRQELADLDRQMTTLREKAKAATAEGERARETLDKLKAQSDSLKQEAEKLKTTGGAAWEKSRDRLNEALGRLKQSVNDANRKVDQNQPANQQNQ